MTTLEILLLILILVLLAPFILPMAIVAVTLAAAFMTVLVALGACILYTPLAVFGAAKEYVSDHIEIRNFKKVKKKGKDKWSVNL